MQSPLRKSLLFALAICWLPTAVAQQAFGPQD